MSAEQWKGEGGTMQNFDVGFSVWLLREVVQPG